MADLPYDFWLRVVLFLSREDVWTLRSVKPDPFQHRHG